MWKNRGEQTLIYIYMYTHAYTYTQTNCITSSLENRLKNNKVIGSNVIINLKQEIMNQN